MAQTRLTLVSDIDQAWPKAAPFLLPAIELGDEMTPDQVRDAIKRGDMQLAVFERGESYLAMVTDGVTHGNGRRVMRIVFAGGHGVDDLLPEGMQMMHRAAKSSGCNAIELTGRDGWQKKLADYGFRKVATVMECRL